MIKIHTIYSRSDGRTIFPATPVDRRTFLLCACIRAKCPSDSQKSARELGVVCWDYEKTKITKMRVCVELGCSESVCKSGLCLWHYNMFWRKRPRGACTRTGCDHIVYRTGLCRKHYDRKRKNSPCTFSGCKRIQSESRLCRVHVRAMALPCHIDNCKRPRYFKRMCRKHYDHSWRSARQKKQQTH